MSSTVTVAHGDGIGPEIMEAVLFILKEAQTGLNFETVEVGENIYKQGNTSGISNETWNSLKKTKIILKSPITTPQGGGYKSLNVTMRKALGLYANIRPSKGYHPYVETAHPDMDLVIIRENEEDLYAGIEYQHTHNSQQSVKYITRTGCEKIIRYAFEYAVKNNRKKVTCLSKDNIMKITDGLFHKVFNEIAKEYPNLMSDHYIVDIGFARIAKYPENFDVIVTSNLYGDIISDITAEICGSVGLAGSANIGDEYALFEAIHGSAPDIAGKQIANPSGLLNGAIMMLVHLGKNEIAEMIANAWLKTLEDGIHTSDIYKESISKQKAGTMEFAKAVVARFNQKPVNYPPVILKNEKMQKQQSAKPSSTTINSNSSKELVGVDVFVAYKTSKYLQLKDLLEEIKNTKLKLQVLSIKGQAIWPGAAPLTIPVDDCIRARFTNMEKNMPITHQENAILISELASSNIDFVKTEHLYNFDGKAGFSLAQGE